MTIRNTDRAAEALVHELLHARLIALGYPTFWIDAGRGIREVESSAGIINNAEHIPMLPDVRITWVSMPIVFLGPPSCYATNTAPIVDRLEAATDLPLRLKDTCVSLPLSCVATMFASGRCT